MLEVHPAVQYILLSIMYSFRMTKELRESLVKVAKGAAEKCKVGVRKARQKAMSDLKKKSDISKDSVKRLEKHVSACIWGDIVHI